MKTFRKEKGEGMLYYEYKYTFHYKYKYKEQHCTGDFWQREREMGVDITAVKRNS